MALLFLIAFQIVFVISNQSQSSTEHQTDIKDKNQYQNKSPTDFGNPQNYLNEGGENQMDSESFEALYKVDEDSRNVQDPNESSIKQNPNEESTDLKASQDADNLWNSTNSSGNLIKDLNESAQGERKLQDNRCNYGQYYDGRTSNCIYCHRKFPMCLSCNETSCNTCLQGNLTADETCILCPDGCDTCDQTGCITCKDSYYKDSDGECLPCDVNCKKCDANSCLECNDWSFMNELSHCTSCYSWIPNCSTCDKSGCKACHWGYTLKSYSADGFPFCAHCNLTYPNCADCDESGCRNCLGGYRLSSSGHCVDGCDDNCITCTDFWQCTQCNQSFYLDEYKKCQPCPSNCLNCDQNGCNLCQSGYTTNWIDSSVCIKCPDNCLYCDGNPNWCMMCNNGYYISSDGSCKLCSEKFGESCNSCIETACLGCVKDNYVPNTNGTCVPCTEVFKNCQHCSGIWCSICDDYYYWDYNGNKCRPCAPGCKRCYDSNSCSECENWIQPYQDGTCELFSAAGTYWNAATNSRKLCSYGCRNCNSPTSCSKCWAANMINNGDGTCSCKSNSYAIGYSHTCQPCSDFGCKTCEVVDLFYGKSIKCILPLKCSGDKNMRENVLGECECAPGYWLDYQYPRACQPCAPGCADCRNSIQVCEACLDAYYMVNNLNGSCSCIGNMTYNSATFRCEGSFLPNSTIENPILNCAEYGTSGCSKCEQGHFLYDNSGVLECLSCSESCNSCDPHPGCYLCGTTIEKESSTCTSDNSVGYLTSFEDGNLILDFAYDLPEPLSLKEIIIKSPGNYDTSSWHMTQVTPRQYMISTNLQDSDLPIDVRFKFNRG